MVNSIYINLYQSESYLFSIHNISMVPLNVHPQFLDLVTYDLEVVITSQYQNELKGISVLRTTELAVILCL